MEVGFVREAKQLSKLRLSITAREAIGYRELFQFLRGAISRENAIDLIKKRTRHLAKKQLIWFRRMSEIHWCHAKGNSHLTTAFRSINTRGAVAERVLVVLVHRKVIPDHSLKSNQVR